MKRKNYEDWSREELIKELDALRKQKTYGLVWEKDKTKEIFDYYINWDGIRNKETFKGLEDKFPVLRELKGKEITTEKNGNYNLLIEGDNYHSLAVLNFTHDGAVDVIYIDPPYNTGNGNFKYNDQWVDFEDQYRHSKWLSFMEKRLKLAKNLLKNTGFILISIDDNEYAQLKILCDEIFLEPNYIGTIVRRRRQSQANLSKNLSVIHEYLLCYKRSDKAELRKIASETSGEEYKNPDNDLRGPYTTMPCSNKGGAIYEITTPTGVKHTDSWRFIESTYKELLADNRIAFPKKGSGKPRYKLFQKEKESAGVIPNSWWEDAASNQEATRELKEIFCKENVFSNPKPVGLIKKLTRLAMDKDGVMLDFFAGSGTTVHAILDLNKEDGGRRQFILCTDDEGNICSEICYPRLEKVINGYTSEGKEVDGLGGNLKYFKTDFVDSAPTDKNKKKIVDKSTEMICIKENAFELVKESGGDYRIFKNHEINLGIIFNSDAVEDFVKEAKKITGKFHVYVFSLDDTVPEYEFRELKSRLKLCAIPEAILHVYRRVFS
jgi:adenine-specific DNA-methyltransferase